MRCSPIGFSVLFLVFASPSATFAALIASDSAADVAYNDGWDPGDNGGIGFFPWTLVNTVPNSGHFVASSTGNGDGDSNADGDIDTAGRAWGMFANSGPLAAAFRGFGSPLASGDTFRVSMDTGWIDNGAVDLMALRTFNGDNRMELLFIGGQNTYLINDSVVGFDTLIPFTDEGLEIAIQITGANTYDLAITDLASGTTTPYPNRTFAGAGEITNFRGANVTAGSGPEHDIYFNSISIDRVLAIPEPSTFAVWSLLGLALSGACWRRYS